MVGSMSTENKKRESNKQKIDENRHRKGDDYSRPIGDRVNNNGGTTNSTGPRRPDNVKKQ